MVGGFWKTILSTVLKDLPEEMFLFLFHLVTRLGWHLELHSRLAISWKVSFRMVLTPTREIDKDLIWILLRDGSILDREVTKGSPWLPHAFAGGHHNKASQAGQLLNQTSYENYSQPCGYRSKQVSMKARLMWVSLFSVIYPVLCTRNWQFTLHFSVAQCWH